MALAFTSVKRMIYEERKRDRIPSKRMKNGRPVPVRVWPVAAPPRAQIVSAFSCVGRDANGNERETNADVKGIDTIVFQLCHSDQ